MPKLTTAGHSKLRSFPSQHLHRPRRHGRLGAWGLHLKGQREARASAAVYRVSMFAAVPESARARVVHGRAYLGHAGARPAAPLRFPAKLNRPGRRLTAVPASPHPLSSVPRLGAGRGSAPTQPGSRIYRARKAACTRLVCRGGALGSAWAGPRQETAGPGRLTPVCRRTRRLRVRPRRLVFFPLGGRCRSHCQLPRNRSKAPTRPFVFPVFRLRFAAPFLLLCVAADLCRPRSGRHGGQYTWDPEALPAGAEAVSESPGLRPGIRWRRL